MIVESSGVVALAGTESILVGIQGKLSRKSVASFGCISTSAHNAAQLQAFSDHGPQTPSTGLRHPSGPQPLLVSQFGLAVRRKAGKQRDLGSIPLRPLSFLGLEQLWSVDTVSSCDCVPHS